MKITRRLSERKSYSESTDAEAKRIVQLVDDKELRDEMGHKAREAVRKNFLLTRYLEQYLDLFAEL